MICDFPHQRPWSEIENLANISPKSVHTSAKYKLRTPFWECFTVRKSRNSCPALLCRTFPGICTYNLQVSLKATPINLYIEVVSGRMLRNKGWTLNAGEGVSFPVLVVRQRNNSGYGLYFSSSFSECNISLECRSWFALHGSNQIAHVTLKNVCHTQLNHKREFATGERIRSRVWVFRWWITDDTVRRILPSTETTSAQNCASRVLH